MNDTQSSPVAVNVGKEAHAALSNSGISKLLFPHL